MARTLLPALDPTFVEITKALYGDAVDPRELYVSKSIDSSEVHIDKASDASNKKKLAAGLVFGAGAESLGAVRSVQAAKEALVKPKVPAITGVKAVKPRLTSIKGIARRAKDASHTPGGKVGEAAYQAANLGVGLLAARELVKKPKKQSVGKAFRVKPLNDVPKKVVTLAARRPGLRLVAKSMTYDPMTGERVDPNIPASVIPEGTLPIYDTQTGLKLPRNGRAVPPRLQRIGAVSKSDSVTWRGEISKVDEDKRQVFGWASLAELNGQPVVDLQGDYVPLDEIEKSAYAYVIESRVGGDMHSRVHKGLTTNFSAPKHTSDMIESFVATPEKLAKMGLAPDALPLGWWVGFHVNDDEQWNLVKSGARTGFSIHGSGTRVPVSKRDEHPKLKDRVEAAAHPPPVKLKPVSSSAIAAMGYQRQTRRLAIEMHSRPDKPYQYRVRPLDAKKAEDAPSLGRHYSQEIRGKAPHAKRVRAVDRARLFLDPPKKDVGKALAQVADAASDGAIAVKRIQNAGAGGPPKQKRYVIRPIANKIAVAADTAVPPLQVIS